MRPASPDGESRQRGAGAAARLLRQTGLVNLQVPLYSVVQAGVQMGIAVLSARWLGPGDRGDLVLATTIGSLLLLVSSVGTGAASRVVLAEPGRWWTWPRYLRLAAALTVPHVVLAATVGVALLSWLSSAGPGVLVAFVVYSATALGAHLVREGLHGLGRHRASVAIDVTAAAIQLGLIAGAQAAGRYSPATALYIASLCFAGAIATGVAIGWRADAQGRAASPASTREWWQRTRELLAFSRLALVAALGQSFVFSGDRLVLGALGSSAQVGIYSVASTLASLSSMAPLALTPLITRKTAERGTLQAWHRTHLAVLAVTAATAGAVAAVGWFAIPILLGEEFLGARPLLLIFCAAMVPYASLHFDSAACAGLRDLRTGALAAAIGCVALLVLDPLGHYLAGTHGLAAGTLATYLLMAVVARVRLRRAASRRAGDGALGAAGPGTVPASSGPPQDTRNGERRA